MKTDWSNYTIAYGGINYSVNYRDNGDLVACENYVAASPTPKNHQPLISNLPAGTYKVADYKGDWWEFTLTEDLRGIGGVRDSVEFDKYSNGGYLRNKIGKLDLGTLSWESVEDGRYRAPFIGKMSASALIIPNILCTNYIVDSFHNVYYKFKDKTISNAHNADMLYVYDTAYNDVATFKTAMSGAILAYELSTPTRTPLTFTLNNSSTAPECPMEFLTDTPSLEYPAEVWDAGGTVKVANADDSQSQTATTEILRSNADGTVYDEFEVKSGKVTRKIGRIESYNGEDVGDDWISSTGALDTGATVEYVLAEPIEEQYTPVILPTYYPTTVVTTTNNTPAELTTTATVKVEDD